MRFTFDPPQKTEQSDMIKMEYHTQTPKSERCDWMKMEYHSSFLKFCTDVETKDKQL